MEQAPPDGENVSSDSSEETDSDEGTPRCCHCDSISQAEEESEDREDLAGEPTKELAGELTKELTGEPAKKLTGEPAEGPTEGPNEEPAVEHLTLRQESPLGSIQESEERVVIHASEEEIDHLC